MNILIIKNKLGVEVTDDVKKAFDFLESKTPIKFSISYMETNITPQYKKFDLQYAGTTGTKDLLLPLIKGKYDAVIFLYGVMGNSTPFGALTGWTFYEGLTPDTEYVEIPCSPYGDAIKWIEHAISHEMLHVLCKIVARRGRPVIDEMDKTTTGETYLHNDNPNHPDGNYSRTLKNLAPYWDVFTKATVNPTIKPSYKYFKANEVVGLKEEFVRKLDEIREEYGFPMVITSGLRTKAQNDALKDSASDSAHLDGLACDLACNDSFRRLKLIKTALKYGIRRIGIGNGFVHLDIHPDKPQDVMWTYYK